MIKWSGLGALFYCVPLMNISQMSDVPDFITDSIPWFFILVALEAIIGRILVPEKQLYTFKDTTISVLLGIVQQMFGILIKGFPYGIYLVIYEK